ncbi:tetratricopeptide repeat protein [Thalassovita sp.]|uniref:tetratricopeptide repeat protein n=1 Tax=Thalassovita sp. TaxID=1979401 RepID=UPI0028812619|nr:tetratricopeptide repeat protein [Thalassovita sp.]MDF1803267.1 tetratricopeptide repeat protein [Thalassovita sp.]
MRKRLWSVALALAVAAVSPVQAQGIAGSYLAARSAGMSSDYKAAADYFTRALARDPSNPHLLESTVLSQLSLGEVARAIPVARKMEADGLQSQIARLVLVADEAATGKYDALLARLDEERGIGPLVDGLLNAWALMGNGSVSAALKAFDGVAAERGLAAFALYHKAMALASVGDFEGAEAIFADSAGGPLQMTRRGAIARVEILSQLDQGDTAMGLLDELFGRDFDPAIQAIRARLEAGETLPFTMVQDPRQGVAEVFYSVAAALNAEAGEDYTLLYTRVVEYLRPDHTDGILLSASLLDSLGRYELASATYKSVVQDSPSYFAAELGRAETLRKAEKLDSAVEVLEQLTRSHGAFPMVWVTLGDLMRQLKRFDEATVAYDTAVELYGAPSSEHWFIYYARAISFERLGEWPKAEADFRTALELNPNQPQVLNYLGYSLVEHKLKLDEALSLIEQAVEARPDSGYIVDSLGWALYRLGRYEDAIGHMERAAELMPVDPVVNDHLGDVLWAVGRKREAEFQWHRALSFAKYDNASGDVDADRIRRKLEVGLDVVLAEEGAPPLKVAHD